MVALGDPPAPHLAIGQELLEGRLVIQGVLGSGTMGVVYKADDRRLGRPVALKTLARFDADRLYQLKREFRTLERLSHPNLVKLYELCTTGDLWFLILELIDGVELTAWLRQQPALERTLRVFGELAAALRVLHAAGLLHRDVKPSNVMVKSGDHAVLLDFGLAVPLRGAARTMAAGTLDYIAPEQLWSESPAAGADWYSFGVVLYQALTGVLPLDGLERLKAMQQPPPSGPGALTPGIPAALDEVVLKLLDPDPTKRPGPADIIAVLDTSTTMPVSPPAAQTQFVGRSDILARLHQSLADVATGSTKVVHLRGPSGIGKTALARHFLDQACAASNPLVLEGACHPQESVPYKALDALIDNLTRYLLALDHRAVLALAPRHGGALVHVFPVLGRVPGVREWAPPATGMTASELRRRGFDAMRELIGKLSDRQPVVLWIDDIQWSDRDSGAMLQALLAPPDAPRCLLLLTSRDEEADSALIDMLSGTVTPDGILLNPLSTTESQQLAWTLTADCDAEVDVDALTADAGGSPFLLGELVRHLREPASGRGSQTLSLTDVLEARFSRLTPEARRLIEVVSIAGRPIDADLALDVAGAGAEGRLLVYSMCSESLLRISGRDEQDFLAVYHDRLGEFAVGALKPERKQAYHRALAKAIRLGRNPDVGALVRHHLAAGDRDDAAHFALAAAQEAERNLAFDQAVSMYDLVLDLRGDAGAEADLLDRRARALANAARRMDAALAFEAAAHAVGGSRSERRTALHVLAAEQFFYGGELRKGLGVLNGVLGEVDVRVSPRPVTRACGALWRRFVFIVRGPGIVARDVATLDPSVRIRLDALWRATRGVVMLDPGLADALAARHLLESLRAGDQSRALRAIGLEAAFEANIGGRWFLRRSDALLTDAERAAEASGNAYDIAWLAQCRSACAWFEGRWRDCVTLGEEAERRLRRAGIGVTWDLTVVHGFVLSALANLGCLQELSLKARDLVRDAERRHDRYALHVFQTGDAVMTHLALGEVDEALRVADESLHDYPPGQFTSQHRHHLVATVQSHLYLGDAEQAWARIERAWPSLRWSGFLLLDCLGTQLRYLKACAALAMARGPAASEAARFLRIARREARRIRRSTLSVAAPMADAIDAGIAGAKRRLDRQAVSLRAAAEGFARAEMALHREAARCHLADIAPGGDSGRTESYDWMTRQGIVHPASMARAVVPPA